MMSFVIASGVFACDCEIVNDRMQVGLLVIGVDSLLGSVVDLYCPETGEYYTVKLPNFHPPIGAISLFLEAKK